MWRKASTWMICSVLSGPVLRAEEAPGLNARENAWALGFHLRPIDLGDSRKGRVRPLSPALTLQRLWIKPSWWFSLDAALNLGPNGTRFPDSPAIDFTGTGFGASWAMPVLADSLRQADGDWALGVGLESYQMIGRSYEELSLADGSTSGNWVIRNRWTAVIPSLFYTNLATARPKGYQPEWLVTRIEGYVIQFGLSIPVQSHLRIDSLQNNQVQSRTSRSNRSMALLAVSIWMGI